MATMMAMQVLCMSSVFFLLLVGITFKESRVDKVEEDTRCLFLFFVQCM
jgi:hypothetical protein